MKNILFASSEAVPYMKTGGLADVVGSLPRYFNKEEYDVRVILPKYACMDEKFLPDLTFVCHFYVNLNWRRQYVGIFETEYKGVHFYFVDNEFYFKHNALLNNKQVELANIVIKNIDFYLNLEDNKYNYKQYLQKHLSYLF